MSLQWEKLIEEGNQTTYRLKVHGGWIVMMKVDNKPVSITTSFVPDAEHKWVLE